MGIKNFFVNKTQVKTITADRISNESVLNALRTVITYTLVDAFDLNPDEATILNYKVAEALLPFKDATAHSIPQAVFHEIKTQEYSRNLSERTTGTYYQREKNDLPKNVALLTAEFNDWVEIILEMVTLSYHPININSEITLRANISLVLSELGIGAKKNPRESYYLPNAVRYNLALNYDK